MDLLTQPPPDVPAPPPGPEAMRSRAIFRRVLVIVISSAILCGGALLLPIYLKYISHHNVARREALNNARQIHLCLVDFEVEYGSFPDASTIPAVKSTTGTGLPLGTSSSNEVFRQLIAAGHKSEKIFWVKSSVSPRRPDNNISGGHALEKAECAFAYVAGLTSTSDAAPPLLLTPVDPGKRCFERRWDYKNMAVILFADGTAKPFPIDKHGRVQLNGMDLFDPRQPFWKGKAPDIKWPE